MWYSVAVIVIVGIVCSTESKHHGYKRSLHTDNLKRISRATTYRVGVLELPPYVLVNKNKTDGVRFRGFLIDVLSKISKKAGFKYEFYLQEDGHPGRLQKTGYWDGLIGAALNQQIDIIAGPIQITATNEKVLKFSKPIASTGVSFLVKIPQIAPEAWLFLLHIFSLEIWFMIIIVFILVSVLFYIISRFSPYSRTAQSPLPKTGNGLCKRLRGSSVPFSLKNSCFFMINAFSFQGHSKTPRNWSSRILTVFWAVFCLWIIVAYAANLAAFILAGFQPRILNMFRNIEEVMSSSFGRIGVVKHRYEDIALKGMPIRVYNHVQSKGSFLGSYEEGIKRLQNPREITALAMDSLAAKYVAFRHCNFRKFHNVNSVGVGFATAIGSSVNIMDQVNRALSELIEDGSINQLLNQWLNNGALCPEENVDDLGARKKPYFSAYTLNFNRLSAPFLLIFVGILLAIVVFIAEIIFVCVLKKKSNTNELSTLEEANTTKEEALVTTS